MKHDNIWHIYSIPKLQFKCLVHFYKSCISWSVISGHWIKPKLKEKLIDFVTLVILKITHDNGANRSKLTDCSYINNKICRRFARASKLIYMSVSVKLGHLRLFSSSPSPPPCYLPRRRRQWCGKCNPHSPFPHATNWRLECRQTSCFGSARCYSIFSSPS